ncbi:hypothetical protein ACGFSI_12085 [Streptomyces virginiae]|uniref:hypothetical protein n=1 Tax=Streptomyces virginiae TaxID=1961 RepID=UPI003722D47F
MDDPDESFAVGLELGDLGFVVLPELFELDDLLPQSLLAVWHLSAGSYFSHPYGLHLRDQRLQGGRRLTEAAGLFDEIDDLQC